MVSCRKAPVDERVNIDEFNRRPSRRHGHRAIRIMGEYWAPEPVARVVNNHLSPGLRGNAIYDAYRGLGNTLNQAQLGLSAFHLGFTSMDATVSRAALGLEYLASGQAAQGRWARSSRRRRRRSRTRCSGAKIRARISIRSRHRPDLALANAVKEAGGRVKMDSFYKNSAPERMIEAWKKDEHFKAAGSRSRRSSSSPRSRSWSTSSRCRSSASSAISPRRSSPSCRGRDARRSPRRAREGVGLRRQPDGAGRLRQPVLESGRSRISRWRACAPSAGISARSASSAAASVDLAEAGAKAGWAARSSSSRTARRTCSRCRSSSACTAPLYQMLRTGEGRRSSRTTSIRRPASGRRRQPGARPGAELHEGHVRVRGPSVGDGEAQDQPALSMVFEMLENEDFYGDQIRNPTIPLVQQVQQEAAYVAKQVAAVRDPEPDGDEGARASPVASKAQNFFGITPAPRSEVRSDAQNLMGTTCRSARHVAPRRKTRPRGSRGPRCSPRCATTPAANTRQIQDAVSAAIERHQLTPKDVVDAAQARGLDAGAGALQAPDAPQALDVFKASRRASRRCSRSCCSRRSIARSRRVSRS
jgi:hypothetical protein